VKQRPSLHNGYQKPDPDPNKHGKFGPMRKWYWLFLCFEGAVQHESLPHGQTVNREYYLEVINCLWEAGKKKACFFEGRKNRCSATMLLHIPHCLFITFLQSWDHHHPTTTVIVRSHTSRLIFDPEVEIHIGKLTFRACWEHPRKFTGEAACYSTKSNPETLPKLEKMLGAVYRSGGNYFKGDKAE
jgi:hypothetical protein